MNKIAALLLLSIVFPLTINAQDDGKLDTAFGTDGSISLDLGGSESIRGAAMQLDEKIVVAGFTRLNGSFSGEGFLMRFERDGSIDPEFGPGGYVSGITENFEFLPSSLAIQADGKIVAVGSRRGTGAILQAVVRFNSDGTLDSGFGDNGLTSQHCAICTTAGKNDVAIAGDGRILAMFGDHVIEVQQFLPDGEPDPEFGDNNPRGISGDGLTILHGADVPGVVSKLRAENIAVQPDGKILVVGTAMNLNPSQTDFVDSGFVVARYLPDGTPDYDFGGAGTGIVFKDIGNARAHSIAVQANGKIVISGERPRFFIVARFMADGQMDESFGDQGLSIHEWPTLSSSVGELALVEFGGNNDARIILGSSNVFDVNAVRHELVRLNSDGSLDSSFDRSAADFGASHELNNLILRFDRFWTLGSIDSPVEEGRSQDIHLARYVNSGEIGIGVTRQFLTSMSCPADLSVENIEGFCGTFVDYSDPVLAHPGFVECDQASGAFFDVGNSGVSCTSVVGDGKQNQQRTASCSFNVAVEDTESPQITCSEITVSTDAGQCSASPDLNLSVSDNCPTLQDPISTPPDGSVFALGTTPYSATVADASGNIAGCSSTVTVVDNTPPDIDCNTDGIHVRPGVSSSFRATATDACSVASLEVTSYDCWQVSKNGKKVDKTNDCVVSFSGADLNIEYPSGVGTIIGWQVEATDGSGNVQTASCEVETQNPSRIPD